MTEWKPNFRDNLVSRLANFVLSFATPYYQKMIGGSIRYGMNSAARDTREGRESPPNWEDHDRYWEDHDR